MLPEVGRPPGLPLVPADASTAQPGGGRDRWGAGAEESKPARWRLSGGSGQRIVTTLQRYRGVDGRAQGSLSSDLDDPVSLGAAIDRRVRPLAQPLACHTGGVRPTSVGRRPGPGDGWAPRCGLDRQDRGGTERRPPGRSRRPFTSLSPPPVSVASAVTSSARTVLAETEPPSRHKTARPLGPGGVPPRLRGRGSGPR